MYRAFLISLAGLLLVTCTMESPPAGKERRTDPGLVLNKTWQWVSTATPTEQITVPAPERYTLHLAGEGRIQAKFDCNSGGGTYEMDAGKLLFGPLMATRMACPDDSLDFVFMADLQRVQSFFVQAGELHLILPADSGTMRFRLAP